MKAPPLVFHNIYNLKNRMNKTKIVATMGPSSSPREVLKEMFIAGLNVCRVNFSHGSYDQHAEVIRTVRELNEELGANVAVLADLQGPKIRTGEMENNGVLLEVGAACQIITENIVGTASKFCINYSNLPKDVSSGERILLDDGKLILEVVASDKKSIIDCKVIQGGILSSKKGVNFPKTKISLP